jgi:two-component system sensor histidine kinase ChiS
MEPLILIVDDKPEFLDIFGTALTAAGYKVKTAADGPSAIQLAVSLKPDLVLLDVEMPGMNGVEVLTKMRDNPELVAMKIAFLTNLGGAQPGSEAFDTRIAKEIGATTYLKKTEDLNVLVSQVRGLLALAA